MDGESVSLTDALLSVLLTMDARQAAGGRCAMFAGDSAHIHLLMVLRYLPEVARGYQERYEQALAEVDTLRAALAEERRQRAIERLEMVTHGNG